MGQILDHSAADVVLWWRDGLTIGEWLPLMSGNSGVGLAGKAQKVAAETDTEDGVGVLEPSRW